MLFDLFMSFSKCTFLDVKINVYRDYDYIRNNLFMGVK